MSISIGAQAAGVRLGASYVSRKESENAAAADVQAHAADAVRDDQRSDLDRLLDQPGPLDRFVPSTPTG